MARKAEPGIEYYPMRCDHVDNKKIKLIIHEMGTDAYWIWSCIISYSYKKRGYYFDLNDKDDLLLFSEDICKKPIELVLKTIECCVTRGLFDKDMHKKYNILTSDRIQENYIIATSERRRKSTVVRLIEEYLLCDTVEGMRNLEIVPLEDDKKPKRRARTSTADETPEQQQVKVKEMKLQFGNTLEPFLEKYGHDMLTDFFRYWGEPTPNMKKLRWQLEKTWDVSGRLATWHKKSAVYNKGTGAEHTQQTSTVQDEIKQLEQKTRAYSED